MISVKKQGPYEVFSRGVEEPWSIWRDGQPYRQVWSWEEVEKILGTAKKVRAHATKKPTSERTYPMAPRDEWYSDANYEYTGGKLVMMTPDAYLKKVRPLKFDVEGVTQDNIDYLKSMIEQGRSLDPLKIYADGKEDGRHRAYAAKQLGIYKVPVIVWASKTK